MRSSSALLCAFTFAATALAAVAQTAPPQPLSPPLAPPPAQAAPAAQPADDDLEPANRRGALAACRKDARQLCSDVPRGKGSRTARTDCLVANRDKVSADCAAVIAAIETGATGGKRTAGKGVRPMAACQTDLATHCASAEPGNGGRMKCLRANETKLTAECRASIDQVRTSAKQTRQAIRTACQADAMMLCAGVDRNNGGLRKCLNANAAKLSPPCGEALAQSPVRKRDRG